ncbi:hypothetical protein [Mycobacterium camsae]|uniref:hypothetical protein n=1 Tax=Mycobacterium gordonae TaxID=1778 RepID=UPI00197FF40A|nr:hypothetical protein [Mycobacterium gordonae]
MITTFTVSLGGDRLDAEPVVIPTDRDNFAIGTVVIICFQGDRRAGKAAVVTHRVVNLVAEFLPSGFGVI